MYIYIYIYTCIFICVYTHEVQYMYIHIYMYDTSCVYTHIYTHMYTNTSVYSSMCNRHCAYIRSRHYRMGNNKSHGPKRCCSSHRSRLKFSKVISIPIFYGQFGSELRFENFYVAAPFGERLQTGCIKSQIANKFTKLSVPNLLQNL